MQKETSNIEEDLDADIQALDDMAFIESCNADF